MALRRDPRRTLRSPGSAVLNGVCMERGLGFTSGRNGGTIDMSLVAFRETLPVAGREAEAGTMKIHNVRTPVVAAFALTLAGLVSLSFADQVVYFTNGKAIMVKKVEKGDDVTILELEGGGHLGVPTERIVRIEEYAVSKPGNARPPAAPQTQTATRTPPAAPGGARPGAPTAATSDAVSRPANLVADAPSVVPVVTGESAAELAAPREPAQGAVVPDQRAAGSAGAPPQPQVAPARSAASASAADLAARASMAAKMQARGRNGRLTPPRGRGRPGGPQRGEALMAGQSPRRPGQGAVQGGASVPAGAPAQEVILAKPKRGGHKGDASDETVPPSEDSTPEETPSEAN